MKVEKKIIVEVHGRLGNQLFQYAFARSIALQTGGKIFLNFHYLDLQAKRQPQEKGWEDSLQTFRTNYVRIDKNQLSFLQHLLVIIGRVIKTRSYFRDLRRQPYPALHGWARFFAEFSRKHAVYQIPDQGVPFVDTQNQTVFLQSFFEDEARVKSVRSILLEEFWPREPLFPQNEALMQIIENENSVCVTIRRGDFIGKKQLFMCDEAYFLRGIEEIKARVKNPVFIFFSDDLIYAKDFAAQALGNSRYFVETPNNSVAEKLRLMRSCKHFIISNSTFSWWAQYLGEADDKVVIGPKRWMPDMPENQAPVMKSWVRV